MAAVHEYIVSKGDYLIWLPHFSFQHHQNGTIVVKLWIGRARNDMCTGSVTAEEKQVSKQ